MLRLLGNAKQVCQPVTRRETLFAAGASLPALLGAGVGSGVAPQAAIAGPAGVTPRAKSVICLYLFGGWSQYETFDPKPEAAVETRGPFQAIPSCLPGLAVGEYLPQLARRMDRLALVNSVNSADANHNTSLILTGREAVKGGTATKGFNPGIPFD
ncbi:MAG: DUF1501 domain-containing protein, partial [Planctomycetaceae bacterium]